MTTRPALSPRWILGFALSYAALTLVARLTVVDGRTVSLIWPGAGLAMLWLLAENVSRQVRTLALLGAVHGAVVWLTGAAPVLAVFGAVSMVCQTWLTVALTRRWCPTLLGAGGTESFRSPRSLGYTTAAGAIGCAAGAVIGSIGVWASPAGWDTWVFQAWFGRQFAGLVVVGFLGHLVWEWRTQEIAPRAQGGSRLELAVLSAISFLAVVVIFLQPLPIVFLVVPLCVWSAARFPTLPAALHALALGVLGLLLTLAGHGPSTRIGDPVQEVVTGQIFLVALLLTGLVVGTLSDRIDQLVAHMAQARARAAAQAELLAEMTESMGEGLIVLDSDGRIERSNGATRRLARRVSPGLTDDLAMATLVDLVLHPAADHTGALRAELGVGDVQVPLASGDDLVLAVSRADLASRRAVDGRSGVLLVLREVTEHRQGIRPLASFASTAAHDLRGPLTAIRAWLDLAAADLDADSDTRASIHRADLASVEMAELIDDLLAHAMAQAGDLVARDVSLTGTDGILAHAAALLGPDDVLDVPEDGLPAVHGDEVALRQVFANLIGNGVKYARPGVPARIRISAHLQGARVVIDVQDNGVGVDERERDLIFQRFHRSVKVRAGLRGSGMGLSICQTVVHRHGGSIECLAADGGQGSVFRFDLPAAKSASEPLSAAPTPPEVLATA